MADYISGNYYLSQAEMIINAKFIYNYLGSRGWSLNAICAMLGNMQSESTINPGIWENLNEGVGPGFGLVQWTPYTKYTNWCRERKLDPSSMVSALKRIEWELENGEQYYPTTKFPETFAEFKVSTKSVSYLAMAFLYNYERPANLNQPNRGTQAGYWQQGLRKEPAPVDPAPDTPTGPLTKKKGLPLWMMYMATRRKV